MAELTGTVTETELFPLVRLLADLRRTGSLRVSNGGWTAHLHFLDGTLVAAAFRGEHGLGAISALASSLSQAEFVYMDGPLPADETVDLDPDLLGNAYEWSPAAGVLPLDAVPRRTNALAETAANNELMSLTRSTVRSLLAVDGRQTIREILADGGGSARLLDLVTLRDLGLITIESAPASPRAPLPTLAKQAVRRRMSDQAPSGDAALGTKAEPLDESATTTERACGGCPMLGLADNPASHFDRPTALHRCYVDGTGQAVTSLQQRDLCLSSGYAMCSRFRAAHGGAVGAAARPQPALSQPAAEVLDAAPVTAVRRGKSGIWPTVSIALAIAAVVANLVVFVRPHFG
jgi:hypothetical protein